MKDLNGMMLLCVIPMAAFGCNAAPPNENLPNPRQLALGDQGTVFAGSEAAGNVYAVEHNNSDYIADGIYVIDQKLNRPTGVEFKFGSLYVAALDRILRYDDVEPNIGHLSGLLCRQLMRSSPCLAGPVRDPASP